MAYVMQLPADTGLALINRAYEADTDRQLFAVWNTEHVYGGKNYPSFAEYRRQCYNAAKKSLSPKQTAGEIIRKAEQIKYADQRRGGVK
jgi:hypothetical protein